VENDEEPKAKQKGEPQNRRPLPVGTALGGASGPVICGAIDLVLKAHGIDFPIITAIGAGTSMGGAIGAMVASSAHRRKFKSRMLTLRRRTAALGESPRRNELLRKIANLQQDWNDDLPLDYTAKFSTLCEEYDRLRL